MTASAGCGNENSPSLSKTYTLELLASCVNANIVINQDPEEIHYLIGSGEQRLKYQYDSFGDYSYYTDFAG